MNKTLAITTIVMVAVVMGMSAVAPVVLQQAEATPGPVFSQVVCDHLKKIPHPSPAIDHLILSHCTI